MLTYQSALRYSHPLLNVSGQSEDGMCQFSPTCSTNPLPYQRPLSRPSQYESIIIKLTCPSTFAESLAKIDSGTLLKTWETCVFWPRVHPPTLASEQ